MWSWAQKNRVFLLRGFYWGLTVLSSVAFSLCSFGARWWRPEMLPVLIQFQTTSVFLAFLVQSGLRAGMRNQYHLGRRRVVAAVEGKILKLVFMPTLVVAGLSLFQSVYIFYPAFSVLHAALTLLMALRIAQERYEGAGIYSIAIFGSIVLPCLYLVGAGSRGGDPRVWIEGFSVLGLAWLAKRPLSSALSWTGLVGVLRRSLGIQLGSFALYLLVFLLGQFVVAASKENMKIAVAFADIQMLCGVQALFFSRVLLFLEGDMIRNQKFGKMLAIMLGWSVFFSVGVGLFIGWMQSPAIAMLYAALSFSFLGRLPLGVVSQFMRETYRAEILVLSGLSSAALAWASWVGYFEQAALWIALFSPTLIAVVLSLRSLWAPQGYFLKPSTAVAS